MVVPYHIEVSRITQRPLARPYCFSDGSSPRPHALLWADARRGGSQFERLAGAGASNRAVRSSELSGRVLRPAWLTACLTLSLALASIVPAAAQPRVRLIATGGTIANQVTGRLTGPELVAQAPSVARFARVEAETFARGSSLSLTLGDWLRLGKRVSDVLAAPDVAGVVITGGTDTLEELAWFLDLTVRSDRPVVVTGAIRRPGRLMRTDRRTSLVPSRLRPVQAARGRGTLVLFNGLVFEARDVEKISTSKTDAFGSRASEPVGRIGEDGVRFSRDVRSRHGSRSQFDVARIDVLPRVDVLLTYQDAPGDFIAAAIRNGARGVVMASAGAGALAEGEVRAVQQALAKGIPVVLASRVEGGSGRRRGGRRAQGTHRRGRPRTAQGESAADARARTRAPNARHRTRVSRVPDRQLRS